MRPKMVAVLTAAPGPTVANLPCDPAYERSESPQARAMAASTGDRRELGFDHPSLVSRVDRIDVRGNRLPHVEALAGEAADVVGQADREQDGDQH